MKEKEVIEIGEDYELYDSCGTYCAGLSCMVYDGYDDTNDMQDDSNLESEL